MKRVHALQRETFMSAKELIECFPGLTMDTIYKWRSKTKTGKVEAGTYPSSVKLGSVLFFVRQEVLDYLNRELLKSAS